MPQPLRAGSPSHLINTIGAQIEIEHHLTISIDFLWYLWLNPLLAQKAFDRPVAGRCRIPERREDDGATGGTPEDAIALLHLEGLLEIDL